MKYNKLVDQIILRLSHQNERTSISFRTFILISLMQNVSIKMNINERLRKRLASIRYVEQIRKYLNIKKSNIFLVFFLIFKKLSFFKWVSVLISVSKAIDPYTKKIYIFKIKGFQFAMTTLLIVILFIFLAIFYTVKPFSSKSIHRLS